MFYLFILAIMPASNPIITILASEKLNGENFVEQKCNMNIVLVCENYKFVLLKECLLEPTANATCTVQEAYDRQIQANNKAPYYMLAGMADVLMLKCEKMEIENEIMESLQAMFGQPSDQSHYNGYLKLP